MKQEDILSGNAGLAGIHRVIHGQTSRHMLRREVQAMLKEGYRAGPFHLTRAKFKPGRKLSVYFTFVATNMKSEVSHPVYLAVAWQGNPDSDHVNGRDQFQAEAEQAGLTPVQRQLWKEIPELGLKLEIWPFDPEFPQLVRLGNPDYVARMLASLDIVQGGKQLPVITPIRYRPGERHVLRYKIPGSGADGERDPRLYAKLYSNEQNAVRAFGVANRVVDWLDANPQGLQGNRPEEREEFRT